jgi:hypothetical protein
VSFLGWLKVVPDCLSIFLHRCIRPRLTCASLTGWCDGVFACSQRCYDPCFQLEGVWVICLLCKQMTKKYGEPGAAYKHTESSCTAGPMGLCSS